MAETRVPAARSLAAAAIGTTAGGAAPAASTRVGDDAAAGARAGVWSAAGTALTPVRWAAGFMLLSAFLRRTIQAPAKLDPASSAYVGKKFVTFLPHALLIQPLLRYLIGHPPLLYAFLLTFTALEGLLGALLILGLATRLSAAGATLLSAGILLGSGWMGSTCVDEWQIGALLVAGTSALVVSGAGAWSVDSWWMRRDPSLARRPWFQWLASGPVAPTPKEAAVVPAAQGDGDGLGLRWASAGAAVLAALVMLVTYQAFHNGLWGHLHNDAKTPAIALSAARVASDGAVQVQLDRISGPDTYGAFVEQVQVLDAASHQPLEVYGAHALAQLPPAAIVNSIPLQPVHTGPFGLVVPLGATAVVHLPPRPDVRLRPGERLELVVRDVSGASWQAQARVSGSA
jgi:uncharacterized membrane protein YphA (DoxX/SURF4 family)